MRNKILIVGLCLAVPTAAVSSAQNGWGRTLRAGETLDNPGDVMEGYARVAVARARAGQTELEWETLPVPRDVCARPTFDFTFAGGMGFPQQIGRAHV